MRSRDAGIAGSRLRPGFTTKLSEIHEQAADAVLSRAHRAARSTPRRRRAALSPFAGNVGNAIWTLLIFVLVVVVLGKFAWGPVLALLQQREQFIHKALADAKHDRDEAEASLKEYTAKLQSAHAEAATMVDEARRDAERLRQEMRQRARTEADKGICRTRSGRFSSRPARALQQIRREAVDLSVMIASKIIQRNLTREDNERLIDDALKQVEGRAELAFRTDRGLTEDRIRGATPRFAHERHTLDRLCVCGFSIIDPSTLHRCSFFSCACAAS